VPQQFYIKDLNETVIIADNPFASGGEGELYDILRPLALKHCVAKIFHKNKRDAEKEAKINYLIKNPPAFEGDLDQQPIIWVKHALHNAKDDFVGFVMPKATGEKLEILTSPKLPKYLGKEWNRFKLGADESLRFRLKVCYNLAAALRTIHATGKYVLVDLKPDNILIKNNGLVSIVDTDSIEVIEGDETLFPATVATPEYTPAEYYKGVKPGKVLIKSSWDCFSLAVIYYRMLFGVHPYAATSKAPYEDLNSLGDKIEHGLFVHKPALADTFEVVPPPHQKFDTIDKNLRKLFLKAFVDGFENPDARPTTEDWGQALLSNPLLLTNRPLPSKSLNLESIDNQNFYVLALQKAMSDQNLLLPPQGKNKSTRTSDYNSETVMKEAMGYYKNVGGWLWKVAKYTGVVLSVVMVLFVAATMISGAPFGDVTFAIDQIWSAITFIPELIIDTGGMGFFFLMLLMPFLIASFRQFTGIAKDSTQEVRKNLVGAFSFTNNQKQKSLEELQYTLYNQRTKAKQQLREIKNELIVWSHAKTKKEKEFFEKNNGKITESNKEITKQLSTEKRGIKTQDEKAKKLMVEEANAIKKLRLDLQQTLNSHPVYSKINGKTIEHKIAFLSKAHNQNNTAYNAVEISQFKAELEEIDLDYKAKSLAIKEEFDDKHALLLGDASQYKIKIDDILKGSVQEMRKKTRIDSNLIDGSFKRLLKTIKKLQLEIEYKEEELDNLNGDIKQLKEELKLFK